LDVCEHYPQWNGPLIDVPHLMVQVQQSSATGIWDVFGQFLSRSMVRGTIVYRTAPFPNQIRAKRFRTGSPNDANGKFIPLNELGMGASMRVTRHKPNQRAVGLYGSSAPGSVVARWGRCGANHERSRGSLFTLEASDENDWVKSKPCLIMPLTLKYQWSLDMVADVVFQRMSSSNADLANDWRNECQSAIKRTTSMTNTCIYKL
jgi:hypothetical protein